MKSGQITPVQYTRSAAISANSIAPSYSAPQAPSRPQIQAPHITDIQRPKLTTPLTAPNRNPFQQAGNLYNRGIDMVTPGDQSLTWKAPEEILNERLTQEKAKADAFQTVTQSDFYKKNQPQIKEALNKGRSFESISDQTGLGVGDIRAVVDVTRPGYGVKKTNLIGQIADGGKAFAKGLYDGATVIPRTVTKTIATQTDAHKQALGSLEGAYQRGEITSTRYQEQLQQLMDGVIGRKVVSDDNGVRVEDQNPFEFGLDFTNDGIDTASVVSPYAKGASVSLNGAKLVTPASKGVLPHLTNTGKQLLKEAHAWNAISNIQSALNGQLSPETILQNAAMNYGMPLAGYGTVKAGQGAKRYITKDAVQAGETASGLPKVNVLNDNEAYTLSDFADYVGKRHLTDASNPANVTAINQLQMQARNAAKTAGIDITSGSARDVQQRIADYLERRDMYKQGYRQVTVGGYLGGPKAIGFNEAKKQGLVFDGVDGKPRFEVDDSGAKLNDRAINQAAIKEGTGLAPTRLGDVLDHPQLYKNYPELKDTRVVFGVKGDERGRVSKTIDGKDEILIRSDGRTLDEQKSTLLHELQHVIQNKENFAKGGDPREFMPKAMRDIGMTTTPKSYEQYQRLAGEAEARAVQARMDMPMSERYVSGVNPAPEKPLPAMKQELDGLLQKIKDRTASNAESDRYSVLRDRIAVAEGKKGAPTPERWVSDKPIRMPEKVYRGTSEDTGNGFAMYGGGTYTAASRTEAAKYGVVKELGKESLPSNPLQFQTKADFSQWEHEMARKLGVKKNELYSTDKGAETLVNALGHDGVTIGTGKDMIAVKFYPDKISQYKPRSTLYDSLDVPKQDLIIKNGEGKAMSVEPKQPANAFQDTLPSKTRPNSIREIVQQGGNPLYHDTTSRGVIGILNDGEIKASQAPFSQIAGQGVRVSTTRNFDNYSRYGKAPYRFIIDETKTKQKAIPDNREEFESIFKQNVKTDSIKSLAIDTTNPELIKDIRDGTLQEIIAKAKEKGIRVEPFEGKILPDEYANKEIQQMTKDAFAKFYNPSPKPTLQDALEGKSTKVEPKEVSPTANSYAHEATPDEILNDTVDYWYKHGKETKGGQMIDTTGELDAYGSGIKRISEHNQFYSDFYKAMKRAPTKKDYEKVIRTQLEKGGGSMVEPDMATAYQLAKTRKAEIDALANVRQDPTDYSVAFDGGVKPTIADALAGKSTKIKVKKETALSQKANQAPGDSKPQTVANASTYTQLNTNRIDLSKEAKNRIAKETSAIVTKLSNNEIKSMAKDAGIDFKSYGVEGTRKKITEQLNVRNEIFTIEKHITEARKAGNKELQQELMLKSAELGRISRSQGTDLGRQLQARRIIADSLATPQQKLYRLFDEAGVDPEVYTKRMADVDMTKPDEVVKAYRDLVPAKFSDWLDKYRYTNMLSSPLTHIVNITSNLSGLGGVAPVQKLVEGAIDATRSAITGAPRTRYASEAGSYLKGVAKSFPEAKQRFTDIMQGKQAMEMPDADALKYGKLANGGALGVADSVFSVIPKLLEASDQFGMTLVKGGERAGLQNRMSKGVVIAKDLTGLVEDKAKYRVFRQELGESGQGHLLEAVDFIPSVLLQARNSKNKTVSTIAKFTVPFVTTPTNLFKQGIEYSPAGILTIPGNSDKVAQLAKMTMGTTVVAVAAATLAGQDAISFAEPSDAKQRDAFRAEGKQAYSIKIGDKWVQYSKLHPAIAFNLALVGGTKDALDKGAIDQPLADKILAVGGGVLGFFRDQSYMKSVGDFTSALEMKDGAQLEDTIASLGSNWANQLVPFKSMISWVGRMIDPTQRKIDYTASAPMQIYQSMVKDIPGLNQNVPARMNPYYKDQEIPLTNPNPVFNSFSPLRVSNDLGYGNTTGLTMTQRREMYEMPDEDKQAFRVNSINQKYLDKVAKEKAGEEAGSVATTSTKKTDKADTGWMDEYNAAKSKYDKESSSWNPVEKEKKGKELATLEVKKHFSKEATSLYDMNKKDIYGFLDKQDDKKAQHYFNQIVDYGDKMVEAGLWSTNKLRDKYGNLQYERGYVAANGKLAKGGSGKKTSGTKKASGGRKSSGGGSGANDVTSGKALLALQTSMNKIKTPRTTGKTAMPKSNLPTPPQLNKKNLRKFAVKGAKLTAKKARA